MNNDLKTIIKLLEEINDRLEKLENKNGIVGTKVNRASRIKIKPIIRMRGIR